jgi:hypothetical protein
MKIFYSAFTIVLIAAIIGWFMNIYKLVGMFGGEITTWFIARCVGIFFAPLGAVIGYL